MNQVLSYCEPAFFPPSLEATRFVPLRDSSGKKSIICSAMLPLFSLKRAGFVKPSKTNGFKTIRLTNCPSPLPDTGEIVSRRFFLPYSRLVTESHCSTCRFPFSDGGSSSLALRVGGWIPSLVTESH